MTSVSKTRPASPAPGSPPAGAAAGLSRELIVGAYRNVVSARLIDAKILILLKQGKVFFHIGGSGHEVAQVATALAMKPGSDWAYPYYRDLGFSLQFGYTIEEIMLEALHRRGGPSSAGFAMPSTTDTGNGASSRSQARQAPSTSRPSAPQWGRH